MDNQRPALHYVRDVRQFGGDFTLRKFFAMKNIAHLTTAFWVKTTGDRRPLVPLSCPSRETFERVVVGRWNGSLGNPTKRIQLSVDPLTDELAHNVYQLSGKKRGQAAPICSHECILLPKIPLLFSSVSFHSRKPDCTEFSFVYCWHSQSIVDT